MISVDVCTKSPGFVSVHGECSVIISCYYYDGLTVPPFPLCIPTQEIYIGGLVGRVKESGVMQFNGSLGFYSLTIFEGRNL